MKVWGLQHPTSQFPSCLKESVRVLPTSDVLNWFKRKFGLLDAWTCWMSLFSCGNCRLLPSFFFLLLLSFIPLIFFYWLHCNQYRWRMSRGKKNKTLINIFFIAVICCKTCLTGIWIAFQPVYEINQIICLLALYPNLVSFFRILRPWQNSEPRSITNTTLCTKCGGAGHIASDCKFTR